MSKADDEDESAPLFFLLALLACVVVPWSCSVLWGLLFPGHKELEQKYPSTGEDGSRVRVCRTAVMAAKRDAHIAELSSRRRLCTPGFLCRSTVLLLLWCWMLYIAVALRSVMATSSLYVDFDPYRILDVSSYASKADVKKAWRKLSLKYHPDKNKEAGAVEKFLIMKKAYDALTDPTAAQNYARYGNPDGPSRVSIGVAIPSVSKEKQGLVLILFLLLFVLGVPITMLMCMGGGATKLPNGVMTETMEMLAGKVVASSDVKSLQALLLASRESLEVRLSDKLLEQCSRLNSELKLKAPDGDQRKFAAFVLLALHFQRKHDELDVVARQQLTSLLKCWRAVALAMAELAARQGWPTALEAAVELHQCLVQALVPVTGGELLQVPHFTPERTKLLRKGPHKNLSLLDFAELSKETRGKALDAVGLSDEERLDVEEFARCVPRLDLQEVTFAVEGEDDICKDDIATLRVSFCRKDLAEGEAAGAVHAPFFPDAGVAEVWWLALTISVRGARTRFARVATRARRGQASLKFKVPQIGKNRCKVTLTCEGYSGLDVEQHVTFDAKRAENPGNGGADPDDEMSSLSGAGED